MKIVRRIVAVLFVAVAVFLIVAVVNAVNSAGGARTGVAVGYIAGAVVLVGLAAMLWRGRRSTAVEA